MTTAIRQRYNTGVGILSAIDLTAEDGFTLGAYLALPDSGPKGGIIVIQEIFGVNVHIRDVCDNWSQEGYAVIAPAIFDRLEKDFESGYSPQEVQKARSFVPKLDMDACMLDVKAAQARLEEYGKVGITGYCLGGTVAFLAATRLPGIAAASCYYGRLIRKYADEVPQCPTQLHYAALDQGIPPDNYEDVRQRRPDTEFYLYENADHGFNCDRRPSYRVDAAKLAWSRTLKMFSANIDPDY